MKWPWGALRLRLREEMEEVEAAAEEEERSGKRRPTEETYIKREKGIPRIRFEDLSRLPPSRRCFALQDIHFRHELVINFAIS